MSTPTEELEFDVGQAEASAAEAECFAERVLGILNDGALCLMLSIGHRTGLLDAMRLTPPATAKELADRAGLQVRYVREWLGAMAAGGIIRFDPATMRYWLPPEHAIVLTRAAAAENMAVFAQYIALIGSVEDDIVRCFREGGGVPYARYAAFHEAIAEIRCQSGLPSFDTLVLRLAPDLSRRLTEGAKLLDLGCGRGPIVTSLARTFPNSVFTGIDTSDEAIDAARGEASRQDLQNVTFFAADVEDFERWVEPSSYDAVTTFDIGYDPWPVNVMCGIHRALRNDGVFLLRVIKWASYKHENVRHALGTFLYTTSCLHSMAVSPALNGDGLAAMWGERKTLECLRDVGFRSIEMYELPQDMMSNWYIARK